MTTTSEVRERLAHEGILRQADAHGDDRVVVEPRLLTYGGIPLRHGARLRSAIESLEKRSHIDRRQARAGKRLYRSYALGIMLARVSDGGSSHRTVAGLTDAQIGAALDFRDSRLAVGEADWRLTYAVCCEDISVSTYAKILIGSTSGRVIVHLMDRLRNALSRLADHHQALHESDDKEKLQTRRFPG